MNWHSSRWSLLRSVAGVMIYITGDCRREEPFRKRYISENNKNPLYQTDMYPFYWTNPVKGVFV